MRPGGGIGRRKGLKIPWGAIPVQVRVLSRAFKDNDLRESDARASRRVYPKVLQVSEGATMARRTCQQCGKKITEKTQSCPRCGAAQDVKALEPTATAQALGDAGEGPTQQSVLTWLDSEIDEARTAATRFGWTGWVLIAALATTLWLLLDIWESEGLNPRLLAKWIIVLALLVDAVGGWGSPLVTFADPRRWGRRFRLFSDLDARRFTLAFVAIRYAALCGLAVLAGGGVNAWARWVTIIFCGVLSVVWIGLVILSFSDLPLHNEQQQAPAWQRVVGVVLVYGLYLWMIVSYSRTISWSPPGDSLSELKAALLVVGTGWLGYYLMGHIHSPPVLGRLLDVRRKLMLGHATPAMALREVEVVVIGMRGNVLLEAFLLKLLEFGSQFDEAARLPLFRVTYFEQTLATWPAARSPELTLTTLTKGCSCALDDVGRLVKMLNEMKKRLDRFQGRMRDVTLQEPSALLAPGAYESLQKIVNFVWTLFEQRKQLAGQLVERLTAVRSVITEKEHTEGSAA